jgi:hypothetical protein
MRGGHLDEIYALHHQREYEESTICTAPNALKFDTIRFCGVLLKMRYVVRDLTPVTHYNITHRGQSTPQITMEFSIYVNCHRYSFLR